MSQNSFAVSLPKRIGLETLFVILALLSLLFMLIAGLWGLLHVVLIPLGRDRLKAFGPWREVQSIAKLIWKHLRYIYRFDFLPAKKFWTRARADKQTKRLQRFPPEQKHRIDMDLPEFEAIDVVTFFAMLPYVAGFTIVAVHATIATATVIALYHVIPHYGVSEMAKTPPSAPVVAFEPTVADKQEADFGPWNDRGAVYDQLSTPSFRNLVLIADTGSMKYAQHRVGTLGNFESRPSGDAHVLAATLLGTGQIAFKDQHQHKFIVNIGQVFLFENDKSYAYVFDHQARLSVVPLTQLKTQEVD